MLISFLYVPLLYHSLDTAQYGVWLTLTSLVSWIAMFDIGLGNGLRNKLAESLAKDEHELGRTYVSTAYVSIFTAALAFVVVFCAIFNFVSWDKVLNAEIIEITQLKYLIFIVFVAFFANFALNLINSVLYALQLPAISNLVALIGQLLSFVAVYVLVKQFYITSLLTLGAVISIVPILVLLAASAYFFAFKYRNISPSFKYFEFHKIKEILSLGVKFFVIQISTIILFQANNLIITHTVGNDAVVEYNIAYKYMHILVMLFSMIATPLWSATTDAYTRGDFDWIKNTCKKLRLIVLAMSVGGLIMLILSDTAYAIWIDAGSSSVNFTTTLLLYLYSIGMIMYGCYGYIINGIGKLNIQIIMAIALSIIYLPCSILAGKYHGLNGILTTFVIITFCNYLWAKIQYNKLVSGTATGIWNK